MSDKKMTFIKLVFKLIRYGMVFDFDRSNRFQ